ncbi:MAG: SDR family oxidoreductase [Anaeromicrobium sp.]|uniref:SDR family oxidoreductase n=1 Tax=Anaeromicrobium sp. TaxID=1929132 RepID=UPI0025D62355|nr:SDR family oxidoreductase [Anaeromicrobium sp.]MCT4596198.1 SDR family oxidoreductase [Anaeromicrobium sp.]
MDTKSEFNLNLPEKLPPQMQSKKPGVEYKMNPLPIYSHPSYKYSGEKLLNKVALITGGDSGIGKAVAIAFAKEGAHIAISYLDEKDDAQLTKYLVEKENRKCILLPGDIGDESVCNEIVKKVIDEFGQLDVLVNNAGEHYAQRSILDITAQQLKRTFDINVFSIFYLIKAALPHLKEGSSIINTASVTAYKGNEQVMDYASSKGAVVSLTRSLAISLSDKRIRVNGVAPGPIWTPLIAATFSPQKITEFGKNTEFGRVGQPVEVAPAYVYLASVDSSYVTGQMIHVNGGYIING